VDELHERMDVTGEGESFRLAGDNEHVSAEGAEIVSATVPVKLLSPVAVMVALP
jgi:hypothetical protein